MVESTQKRPRIQGPSKDRPAQKDNIGSQDEDNQDGSKKVRPLCEVCCNKVKKEGDNSQS